MMIVHKQLLSSSASSSSFPVTSVKTGASKYNFWGVVEAFLVPRCLHPED
jgi:hypothetical protein